MKNLLHLTLRATLGLASTVAATTTSFNANYEDLAGASAGSSAPGLGTYKALTYNAFIVVSNSLAIAGGVAPHSEPNNIITGASFQSMNGTPSITVAPPYKTFTLKDFWFGCDAELQEVAANVATQCTITVAAFKEANGQEVAVASYTFTPPVQVITQVPMTQAVLPGGFTNVYMITIIENDPGVNGLGIDNLEYTVST